MFGLTYILSHLFHIKDKYIKVQLEYKSSIPFFVFHFEEGKLDMKDQIQDGPDGVEQMFL